MFLLSHLTLPTVSTYSLENRPGVEIGPVGLVHLNWREQCFANIQEKWGPNRKVFKAATLSDKDKQSQSPEESLFYTISNGYLY